jgi:glycosyltransferase involved in cell wall biosynthesis
MKILSICLGRELMEGGSFARERQRAYYVGWSADIVCVGTGSVMENQADQLRFFAPGGSNKATALWNAYKTLRSLVRKESYTLVTSQDAQWTGLLAWLVRPNRSFPWQIQDHSGFFARKPFFFSEKCFAPLARWFVQQATRIRTVSERGKRGLIASGVDPKKIDVIPVYTYVPSVQSIPIRSVVKTVFSVGRLEVEKGYDRLLCAWKQAALSGVQLVIAGDGSERSRLEALANSLGISGTVTFLGWQSQEQLASHWQAADVYVQPSWFEGWPRAPWEALQHGLPCILTDTGFVGEIVTETEVVVVKPGSVKELAQALKTLVMDTNRRQILHEAVLQKLKMIRGYEMGELVGKIRESLECSAKGEEFDSI